MAKKTNNVTIRLTDAELDRFLDSLGLLHIYDTPYMEELTARAYEELQKLYCTDFPALLPAKAKPRTNAFFKDAADFHKRFHNYLKRLTVIEFMQAQVKHPTWEKEKIVGEVAKAHNDIFNRAITNAYNDVKSSIFDYKISIGQQPFEKELF